MIQVKGHLLANYVYQVPMLLQKARVVVNSAQQAIFPTLQGYLLAINVDGGSLVMRNQRQEQIATIVQLASISPTSQPKHLPSASVVQQENFQNSREQTI